MNALSPQIAEALVGSTALSPIGPDAEMIATCAAICKNERAYDATGFGHETGSAEERAAEQERERIVAQTDALAGRLFDLPCRTLPGVQAMAQALAAWDRELLKDGPGRDTGEIITSNLVERLLALPTGTADADLLSACTEFRASEAEFCAIYEDNLEAADGVCDALAAPISDSWDGMLDKMERFRATTIDGLAARAMVLGQHSGIRPGTSGYPFAFDPSEPRNDVTGRLLHMLLTDAVSMVYGAALPRNPDADLLAMRSEFDRLHSAVVAFNQRPAECDADCASFDNLCKRIMGATPAVTSAGRALQAAAAMHQMYYRLDESEESTDPIWLMLKAVAGDAYRSTETQP